MRPTTIRPSVRVQVDLEHPAPDLPVVAPTTLAAPAVHESGLAQLAKAVGIGAAAAQPVLKAREAQDTQQGQADAQLGQVDQARAKKSRAYADGAYQVSVLELYHNAEQKVSERAASDELDKSLPLDDQTRIVDGWMKEELGPMVQDPRAKTLIGERYQQFIQTFAGNVLKNQAEANAKAAEDATMQDASWQIDHGTFNWNEQFHRLYSQTGDASRANAILVGVVAQQIENAATNGQDYKHFKDLIPAEVVGPNGEKLPGPMYSPKYRGIINSTMAQAEQQFNKFHTEQYATAEYQARVNLDQDLANDVPITMDTLAAKGYTVGNEPTDTLSPALAAQYIQASQIKATQKNQEAADFEGALNARKVTGRWVSITGMPGAPDSEEKTQKMYDGWVQMVLTGQGAPVESLGGNGLTSNPDLVGAVANLSAQEGMAYGPLKRDLSGVSQAAPGDLEQRIAAYKVLKAKGVVGQYVDDDAALMYEVAIGAQDAGETKDGVAERVRTMGDKPTAQYVAENMRKVKVRQTGFNVPTGGGFLMFGTNVRSTKAMNSGYLASKYEALTASALSKNLSLEDAQKFAENRIQQTHVAVAIQGKWAVLPKSAVPDPTTLEKSLDWYSTQLPELAKKLKIPADEPLTINPRYDINGRGLAFEVDREGGVSTGTVFTAPGLIDVYRRRFPDMTRQKVNAKNAAIQGINAQGQNFDMTDQSLNPANRPGHE